MVDEACLGIRQFPKWDASTRAALQKKPTVVTAAKVLSISVNRRLERGRKVRFEASFLGHPEMQTGLLTGCPDADLDCRSAALPAICYAPQTAPKMITRDHLDFRPGETFKYRISLLTRAFRRT